MTKIATRLTGNKLLDRIAYKMVRFILAVFCRTWCRMAHAAELLKCSVVELPDCRHDAPFSHPELFRTAIVDPLLDKVGAPYTDVA